MRGLLAASWVLYNKSPAPTEYAKLVAAELESDEDNEFDEEMNDDLYKEKTSNSEKARGKRNLALEKFIQNRFCIIEDEVEKLNEKSCSMEKINNLFFEIISQ